MAGSEPITEDVLARARVHVPEHVVFRAFASETVLLNLTTGNYHGLNETASRMLELLSETGSALRAAELVAREYARPIEDVTQDVTRLCAELVDRGLLELASADPS